jgi:hypothetical protein
VFSAAIPFTIDTIIIDPDLWLISGNNITSAVQEIDVPKKIEIYPNPAMDFISVTLDNPGYQYSYTLYSSDGKSVKQGIITQRQNKIDIRPLARGLYSLVIRYNHRQWMNTFIKQPL